MMITCHGAAIAPDGRSCTGPLASHVDGFPALLVREGCKPETTSIYLHADMQLKERALAAHRYLTEVQYRFNRRYDLRAILQRLVRAVAVTPAINEAGVRAC